jgi:hypothetical protein
VGQHDRDEGRDRRRQPARRRPADLEGEEAERQGGEEHDEPGVGQAAVGALPAREGLFVLRPAS